MEGRVRRILGPFTALRHRTFAAVAAGNFVSNLGLWSQNIGVGWAAGELTDSPFLVGLAFGVQYLPVLLVGPFGGLVADRFDRRTVTIAGNLGMALPPLAIGALISLDRLTMASLLLLALLGGVFQALTMPASNATVPHLVPAAEVPAAVAVNSVLGNLSRFVGAALGGLVIASWGTAAAFYWNAVSFSAVVLAWLTVGPQRPPRTITTEKFLARLAGGLHYTRPRPAVRIPLLLTLGTSCFLVLQPLLPLVVRDLLGADSSTYGLLNSATGLGAMGGAFVAGRLHPSSHRLAITICTASVAGSMAAVGLSRSVPLTVVLEVVFGAALFSHMTICLARITLATEDAYLGRVLALQSMTLAGVAPLAGVVGGLIAGQVGLTATIVGAGAAMGGLLLVFLATGAMRALDGAVVPPDADDVVDAEVGTRDGQYPTATKSTLSSSERLRAR